MNYMRKFFKIGEHGLIPFAKRGVAVIGEDGAIETPILDVTVKPFERCTENQLIEFNVNGYVEVSNYNIINKFFDKILLRLIYHRWGKLEKKIDGKTFLSTEYAKRRKAYESLMWEIRKSYGKI